MVSTETKSTGGLLVWVISDKDGLRQRLLQSMGFRTFSIHHDLHSKGHCVRLLQALSNDKPSCLWIRLAGPCAGTGNKRDASRTSHLCDLVNSQISFGRVFVLEANTRSQVWNMQHILALMPSLQVTEHAWCRYETNQVKPCNTVIRLATNFNMHSRLCQCDAALKHADSRHVGSDRDERWTRVLSSIVSSAISGMQNRSRYHATAEAADGNQHRQPELSIVDSVENRNVVPSHVPNTAYVQTCSLERAEAMARDLRLQGDARWETCHLVLCNTPFQTNYGARQICSDEFGQAECYAFGAYAHGKFAGVTNATNKHQELVRYLNFFIQTREKSLRWSSLAVNNNNPLAIHKDVHNLKGELNVLICVGKYVGGGLWLETVGDNRDSETSLRKVGSQMLPGRIHDCHDKILVFDPGLYHGPVPWRGDRWSINAYTSRGFVHLDQNQIDQLRSLKFPIGRSRPGMLAHVARVSFEDGELVDVEASYPTEEAEKRKAKLKAGHVIKPKKFVVEQSNGDLGDDLSSIMEHTDCVSWTPDLAGARSEIVSQSDELESSLFSFVVGKYRWMHGSSAQAPMTRLKQRGVFSMEQFAVSQNPVQDDFIEVMEVFGGDATTTWILSKKHGVKTGWNFDLTVGVNLCDPRDVELLWLYLEAKRPKIILISPPCKRFGLKCFNENCLVDLAAQIAVFQVSSGNHFVAEQPADSNMFDSSDWCRRLEGYALYRVVFDQCEFGLTDRKTGAPVRKPTQLVSSSEVIIRRFAGIKCKDAYQPSEAVLAPRSSAAVVSVSTGGHGRSTSTGCGVQVWPSAFCDLLAQGIVDLLTCYTRNQAMFPTAEKVQCPGCRWHKRKDHPSHDRSEHCKFPDVVSSKWTCAGCLKNKPRGDKTHSLDENCQWNLARHAGRFRS